MKLTLKDLLNFGEKTLSEIGTAVTPAEKKDVLEAAKGVVSMFMTGIEANLVTGFINDLESKIKDLPAPTTETTA